MNECIQTNAPPIQAGVSLAMNSRCVTYRMSLYISTNALSNTYQIQYRRPHTF